MRITISLSLFLLMLCLTTSQLVHAQANLHSQAPINMLKSLGAKNFLSDSEKMQANQAMLILANEARQNPNYRQLQGCKTALSLPSNLDKLVLNDGLIKMAQNQADYQASIRQCTHDNRNFRDYGARVNYFMPKTSVPEACGAAPNLEEEPIGWMKSETHYRPTWNLDNQVVNAVGFGMAKGSDGYWYTTACWGNIKDIAGNNATIFEPIDNAISPQAIANSKSRGGDSYSKVMGYKSNNFTGDESLELLSVNGENLDQNTWNDKIHSISVPNGYQVILHINYRGKTQYEGDLVITQDWVAPVDWQNQLSAVQVSKIKYTAEMKPGDRLLENDRLVSANGQFQLRGTPNGDFIIEEIAGSKNKQIYIFPLGAPWDPKPEISTFYFNPDCNVCINSTQNKNYCATNGRDNVAPIILNKCQKLVLTDYGKLELRTADGIVIWTNK